MSFVVKGSLEGLKAPPNDGSHQTSPRSQKRLIGHRFPTLRKRMHLIHALPFRLLKARPNFVYILAGRIVTDGYVFWPFEQRIVRHLINYLKVCFACFFKPSAREQMVSL